MPRKILVTAALPYSNGPIHIGHLAGAYLPADIYVRYQRLAGTDVVFICGADENGVPITIAAMRQGITPQQLVDKHYALNRDSFAQFGIAFDNFSRTSLPVHHATAQEFFLTLLKSNALRAHEIEQFYCAHDAMFLADRYVAGICPCCGYPDAKGDQCEKCGSSLDPLMLKEPRCTVCGTTPERRTTKHWYFAYGEFQPQLEAWLATKPDWRANVLNYCQGWLNEGLKDRDITRDIEWGVPVPLPEAQGKVLYVWFDAPIGYISSTKEWAERLGQPERWRDYWCDPKTELVHFIGKDNIVFHAVFWPIMLMAVGGYNLPTAIPANEFLNLDGRKLSTSRNYAVWLPDYLAKFPPDLLRYTLAVNLPENKDADFSWQQFKACNNDELADILGNLVNRTLTFIQRHHGGVIPAAGELDRLDREMLEEIGATGTAVAELIEHFKLRAATTRVMDLARAANRYFDAARPWATRASDPQRCATTLHVCCQVLRALAVYLHPVLPFSCARLWRMLGLSGCETDLAWSAVGAPAPIAGTALGAIEILFRKLEDADIQPEVDALAAAVADMARHDPACAPPAAAAASTAAAPRADATPSAAPPTPAAPCPTPQISVDDFARIDLRVAEIVAAAPISKAKKLLKLTVALGAEQRTVVAGIAQDYAPEQLIGRRVVLVANLAPATLRGVTSQGMILAADSGAGLSLVTLDRDAPNGSKVR
jgi:methionyl-tRNA synthetase